MKNNSKTPGADDTGIYKYATKIYMYIQICNIYIFASNMKQGYWWNSGKEYTFLPQVYIYQRSYLLSGMASFKLTTRVCLFGNCFDSFSQPRQTKMQLSLETHALVLFFWKEHNSGSFVKDKLRWRWFPKWWTTGRMMEQALTDSHPAQRKQETVSLFLRR